MAPISRIRGDLKIRDKSWFYGEPFGVGVESISTGLIIRPRGPVSVRRLVKNKHLFGRVETLTYRLD